MDILLNLADTTEKYDINISAKIQDILNTAINANKLLDETHEMIINYTNEDLICMNNITLQRIDNISNLFLNEFEDFCINLMVIDENTIDTYIMDDLKDIFINQELSILRLYNLLSDDMNMYIIKMNNDINREANKILEKYNVLEKINNYIKKSKNILLEKYINEIINNIFPSNFISIKPTEYDINEFDFINFKDFIEKKYNIEIIENFDTFFKWNNNIILYEISNKLNYKKIYIYIDIKNSDEQIKKQNVSNDVLDIDISKIFCIINKNKYNYICGLIEKYLI